jgi:hypothetical protein
MMRLSLLLTLTACAVEPIATTREPISISDAGSEAASEWCAISPAECAGTLRCLGAGQRCFDAGTLTFVYFTCDCDGGLHVIGRTP